jgi:hypothetical protein
VFPGCFSLFFNESINAQLPYLLGQMLSRVLLPTSFLNSCVQPFQSPCDSLCFRLPSLVLFAKVHPIYWQYVSCHLLHTTLDFGYQMVRLGSFVRLSPKTDRHHTQSLPSRSKHSPSVLFCSVAKCSHKLLSHRFHVSHCSCSWLGAGCIPVMFVLISIQQGGGGGCCSDPRYGRRS